MSEPSARLPDDPAALKAMVAVRKAEIDRLHQIIRELQRHRFGRRAESLPVDQLLLGLKEAEQIEAEGLAETDATDASTHAARTRLFWVVHLPETCDTGAPHLIVHADAIGDAMNAVMRFKRSTTQ